MRATCTPQIEKPATDSVIAEPYPGDAVPPEIPSAGIGHRFAMLACSYARRRFKVYLYHIPERPKWISSLNDHVAALPFRPEGWLQIGLALCVSLQARLGQEVTCIAVQTHQQELGKGHDGCFENS